MSVYAGKDNQHASNWSQHLFALLQQMAAQQTNAVLLTLADVAVFESERRYPDAGLMFGNNRWRAYYHCHEGVAKQVNEHGHFHIFTDVGEQQWAHAAALAIDMSGQALRWFAVNRWVTDGTWLKPGQFISTLQKTDDSESDALPGRWLLAMLQLYQAELTDLLQQRDEQIREYALHQEASTVLENRDIYLLATCRIDLQAKLEQHLLH